MTRTIICIAFQRCLPVIACLALFTPLIGAQIITDEPQFTDGPKLEIPPASNQKQSDEVNLRSILLRRFDADLERRRNQVNRLKQRIEALEEILANREQNRKTIVEAQIKVAMGINGTDFLRDPNARKTEKQMTEIYPDIRRTWQAFDGSVDRNDDVSKMKTLLIALHNHMDALKSFPFADNKQAYGWKVQLLPYLGEPALQDKLNKALKSGKSLDDFREPDPVSVEFGANRFC